MKGFNSSDVGNSSQVGIDLAALREAVGRKQSDVAKLLGVDTSRVSRIETGQIIPDTEEVVRFCEAIGTDEAKQFAAYFQRVWRTTEIGRPTFRHPSRADLMMAEETLVRLDDFESKPSTTPEAKAQAALHRQSLLSAARFLGSVEHAISFVGEIGAGKSTAICGITDLLLPPDPKAPTAIKQRVVLETGAGRTTLCEVQLYSQGKATFRLVLHPHSDEEIFQTVSDFCVALTDSLESHTGTGGDGRGVSEEMKKAIRNMAGLTRTKEKANDPALELARQCRGNPRELTAEVLTRMRLDQRTRTEFQFDATDHVAGLRQIRELFARVNKGMEANVSLPRRIDVIVPLQLLGPLPIDVRIIDTKGVDGTAIRPDIRAYLDDPRTLTVLCSRFNNAPDNTLKLLMENLVSTGAERTLAERVVLLVLPRTQEVMDIANDVGEGVESADEGYEIRRDHIRNDLSHVNGANGLPILFLDVLNDDLHAVREQLASAVERVRSLHSQRIGEVGQAVYELITRHGETQTKEAQDKVRESLRVFIRQHVELQPPQAALHEPLITHVRNAHPRVVWASTTRKGSYSGLDAYHFLGVGAVIAAQGRTQPHFSGLIELLGNMLGKPEFEPAIDYINELRRTVPTWRENFLKEATVSGREIFRAELFPDPKEAVSVWSTCVSFYGDRAGAYRDRVAKELKKWCETHGHLAEATERRVQIAWRDSFLRPLAALCASDDLLEESGNEVLAATTEDEARF